MVDHPDPNCPFCNIASAYPPISPLSPSFPSPRSGNATVTTPSSPYSSLTPSASTGTPWDPEKTFPPAFVILSTPDVIAFFDIAPLTRGHVLVSSRKHRVKVADLGVGEGAEIGKWLPLISRAVVKTVLGVDSVEADWNVVQNNGPRAAQVVPHVHFHIVPRPAYGRVPTLKQSSWTMFGRGMRSELDEEDTEPLAARIRERIKEEVLLVKETEGVDLCAGWADEGRGRL